MTLAIDVANWFLSEIDRDAGDSITHLKLQKLAYYAQAWSLALREEPLFEEDFRAWAHGPVATSIYTNFKDYGWLALPAPDDAPVFEAETEELLSEILKVYGQYSAKVLEDMTHNEDPWINARGGLPPEARSSAVIPKEEIATYYRELYEASE
ncbi:MAG: type II toxin-antitoxin system antitoxin SocA domain-containing protein [Candidatus Thiodiazotropha sp. LLP2]